MRANIGTSESVTGGASRLLACVSLRKPSRR